MTPDDTPERDCTRCGESWPATTEFFSRSPHHSSGFHSWCKACQTERKRESLPPKPPAPVPEVFAVQLHLPAA